MPDPIQRRKQELRRSMRYKRQQLSAMQQNHSAQKLLAQAKSQSWHTSPVQVAYHAFDGEVSPHFLQSHGITCGQSILHPLCEGYLLFIKITNNTSYQINRFGIQEPIVNTCNILPIESIDIVYVPLVAFDASGYRLGMGGGFYDRTFANLSKRPLLVGLAHSFQYIDTLPRDTTDIPLDKVVTPEKIWNFSI